MPNSTAFTYKLPHSALFIKNTGLIGIGTTTPRSELEIAGTLAIKIPIGTTAERPSGSNLTTGQIRYNTTLSAYEGYYANSWNTLGGITDTDQDTFIKAETSPGADNDELTFFTANTQRAIIDSSGNLGIGTNTPSSTLDVRNISLNEYLYHNGNTNTNLRLQTDQLTLSTHAQSKLDISTNITLDGGQSTDTNIGQIILKTADPNSNAIQLNAQHATSGITLNSGSNGISITSTGNSNFTSSSGTLTLSGASGLTLTAPSSPIDIDSDTLTIDTTSSVSIDAAAASNFTTSSGALTLSGASGLILAAPSSQIDIDSSTLTIDTTSSTSIDAVGDSNFTTDSGNLTLSTTTSGSILLSSATTIQLQAAASQEL